MRNCSGIGLATLATLGVLTLGGALSAAPTIEEGKAGEKQEGGGVLAHTMKTIDGADKPLADYKGKVLVIVNVASKCGFTPQYEGLQKLYEEKKDKGLVILGFPANNFGNQEPGSDAEISKFCSSKYNVTFPMFSKISVKGADMHPLYQHLTSLPKPMGGEVRWNFEKFVVDRSGEVVGRFGSRTAPDDKELNDLIDKSLEQGASGQ